MYQCPDMDVSNCVETLFIIEDCFIFTADEEHGDGSNTTCTESMQCGVDIAPVKCSTFDIFMSIPFIVSHTNKMDKKSNKTPIADTEQGPLEIETLIFICCLCLC